MKLWSRREDQNLINAVTAAVAATTSRNNNDKSNHDENKINWSNIATQLGTNRSSTACERRYKRKLIPLMKDKNCKVRK